MSYKTSALSPASGDDTHLPTYTPNTLPSFSLPSLILISHSHSPPLNPPPDLKFDVRSLPNPPKNVRDAYNGTSKRLQEWMRGDDRFIERRDEMKGDIEGKMQEILEEWRKRDASQQEAEDQELKQDGKAESQEREELQADESSDAEDSGESTSRDGRDEGDDGESVLLRVGIFCAMGRHRSVAMVEELARMDWPGWRVDIFHRDVAKKRGAGKKGGGKQGRGTRGGGSQFEEME
jgi:hypothetical protein